MVKWITPVEVTPGSASAWVDVDITSYVGADAGSVAGVILKIVNTSGTEYQFGVRKNGSTDTMTGSLENPIIGWAFIGVDSGDIFECYVGSTTAIDVYLVGYITTDMGAFDTNASDVTPGTTGAWTDVDLTAYSAADARLFFFIVKSGSSSAHGVRPNGSTSDLKATQLTGDLYGWAMAGDDGEIVEWYVPAGSTVYYVGYMKESLVGYLTNAADYSTATTASWVDVDFSPDIPSGYDGAVFYTLTTGGANDDFGIRKKGSSETEYNDIEWGKSGMVALDANRYAQQYISVAAVDLYLWAWTKTIDPPTVSTSAATLLESTTATLNGSIDDTGGENADERGFVWDTVSRGDPGNVAPASSSYSNNWTEAGSFGVGSFSHGITGLTSGQKYFFRACAHNSGGWDYGDELAFKHVTGTDSLGLADAELADKDLIDTDAVALTDAALYHKDLIVTDSVSLADSATKKIIGIFLDSTRITVEDFYLQSIQVVLLSEEWDDSQLRAETKATPIGEYQIVHLEIKEPKETTWANSIGKTLQDKVLNRQTAALEVNLDTVDFDDDVYITSLMIVCRAGGRIITVDLQEKQT